MGSNVVHSSNSEFPIISYPHLPFHTHRFSHKTALPPDTDLEFRARCSSELVVFSAFTRCIKLQYVRISIHEVYQISEISSIGLYSINTQCYKRIFYAKSATKKWEILKTLNHFKVFSYFALIYEPQHWIFCSIFKFLFLLKRYDS